MSLSIRVSKSALCVLCDCTFDLHRLPTMQFNAVNRTQLGFSFDIKYIYPLEVEKNVSFPFWLVNTYRFDCQSANGETEVNECIAYNKRYESE